jgi:hypothetical protein
LDGDRHFRDAQDDELRGLIRCSPIGKSLSDPAFLIALFVGIAVFATMLTLVPSLADPISRAA